MEFTAKVYTRTSDNGTHYARIVVPKELRAFVKKKSALWKSLSTKDNNEAFKQGRLVAAGTQLVLQEVSDANAKAVVVRVETVLIDKEIDLAAELKSISIDDISKVATFLREKLGVDSVDSNDDSNSSVRRPDSNSAAKKKSGTSKKAVVGKDDTGIAMKMRQNDAILVDDADVVPYIEKRPHGVYRFRYWIPKSLQVIFGKREVRATLKTADRVKAIEKAKPLLVAVKEKLELLQSVQCIV